MGIADYRPAFCEDCEVTISIMKRQDGALALVCACPEGRVPLDGDRGDVVAAWEEDGPPGDDGGAGNIRTEWITRRYTPVRVVEILLRVSVAVLLVLAAVSVVETITPAHVQEVFSLVGLFALMFWLLTQLVPGREAGSHRHGGAGGTASVPGGEERGRL